MSKSHPAKSNQPRVEFDPDQLITQRIIDSLSKGIIPWRRPWKGGDFIPKNLLTGKEYTGTNIYLLMAAGFEQPWFVTFNQARELGGNVKKGEHGHSLVRWIVKEVEAKDKEGKPTLDAEGKNKQRRFVYPKAFTVFNVSQCEGLKLPEVGPVKEFNPILAAEQVLMGYRQGPEIKFAGGYAASYNPIFDLIKMPLATSFESPAAFYATLFHEAAHSSGHESRLNRDMMGEYGSVSYAKEEFIAELASAVLCARCGISNEQSEAQTVAYCQSWKRLLSDDKSLFGELSKKGIEAARRIAGSNQAEVEPEADSPAVELTPEPAIHPEEVGAPVFSIPSQLNLFSIARLLGSEPTYAAVKASLQQPTALARLLPEQAAAVLSGYEALRLKVALLDRADGLTPGGMAPVEFVPSRPVARGQLIEQAEAVLGEPLDKAALADLSEFFLANPAVRGLVEQRLAFQYVWRQGPPNGNTPDALHCAVKRTLDLDGNLTVHEVSRIFGRGALAPEVLQALRKNEPVLPRAAGEVYDLLVSAVGPEQVHEALVKAGYDSLTSAQRPLVAGRNWGMAQPAGVEEPVRQWTAFAIDPGSSRKVLPLTNAAVQEGVTLSQLGVDVAVAQKVVEGLNVQGIRMEVLPDPTSLLRACPKALEVKLANAEALCDTKRGVIQVIASNVEVRNGETPAAAVTRACLHEAVVHYGVRKALGAEADGLFQRIRAQAHAGFDRNQTGAERTPEQLAFKAVVNDPNYRHLTAAQQGEEILARLQEVNGYEELGAWQRGVAAVRLTIGKQFPSVQLSNQDVNYLLWRGRQAAFGEAAAPTVPNTPTVEVAPKVAATPTVAPNKAATLSEAEVTDLRTEALAAIAASQTLRKGLPGQQPNGCEPVLEPEPEARPSVAVLCNHETYFPNSRSYSVSH